MASEGIRLAGLFGFYPFQLGFCGPRNKRQMARILADYISGKKASEQEVRKILEGFKAAFPYYQLISQSNNISDPFDQRVVKAYWLGNELLENVSSDSLKRMLKKKFKRDIDLPAAARASHCFHILFVGSISGRINLQGRLLDLCRISWGRIKKKEKRKGKTGLVVEYQPLTARAGRYFLGKPIDKFIFWDQQFLTGLKIGERVAIHWNHPVYLLNSQDLANLKKYTEALVQSKK